MAPIIFLFAAAVAPAAFLLHFYYIRDKYEREPLRAMIRVYFISCLTVIPAVLLELVTFAVPMDIPVLVRVAIVSFAIIGPVEEGIKFLFLRWLAFHRPEFNEPYDGILYAVTVSLGFATVENIFYVLSYGFSVAIFRAISAVPIHACLGVIMGWYVGRAKFADDPGMRSRLLWMGFLAPAFAHGVYDFFALPLQELEAAGDVLPFLGLLLATIVALWWIALRLVHHAQEGSPFKAPSPLEAPETILHKITRT
jgi:RsiW-degrading membrane proteinase PrsW (M82 family)